MVQTQLSQSELEVLFMGAMDDALSDQDVEKLERELAASPDLNEKFERYQRTVQALQRVPREQAPEALATLIMRRSRRRRAFNHRALLEAHTYYRVPAEVIVPIIIAALVVAYFVFLG